MDTSGLANGMRTRYSWECAGRGRSLRFFATDAEVQRYLLEALPTQYGPYALVGGDPVPHEHECHDIPFVCPIDQLSDCMNKGTGTRWQFFIWPKGLTPRLDISDLRFVDAAYSLSGLVNLQHGFVRKGKRGASSIGLVDKVVHKQTGQVVSYPESLVIYKRLKAAIQKELCVSSVKTFADGTEQEDTSLELMTHAAAQLAETGFYTVRPGRELTAKRP